MSVVINKQFGFQPWSLVNRLHRDLERTFAQDLNVASNENNDVVDWTPPVDVRETQDAFVLSADVPGVNPQDIEVTTEKGVLTIRGTRNPQTTHAASEHGASRHTFDGYQRLERASGRFLRRFTLPDTANVDSVTAKTTNGVLTLTIAKRAEIQPRRIEVQNA